ncbi:MAG TPA: complex I NDUFA9 subunit family protein [Candidatus Sulfotelmatobacter sp.]|nr:complex I NDUFA9 subunit family protein [Candidatus Sulfotelmatobacter sp.]
MKIAVTGGTGFVGTHCVRALLEAGHQVRVLARGRRRRPSRPEVVFVQGDVGDSTALRNAFDDCQVVLHLAAIIRERGRQTFDRVNRVGTENVVRAAREAEVQHLLQLSVIGAGPDPSLRYPESRWQAEQAVRGSGIGNTVLRSSLIFGRGDAFFTRFVTLIRYNPVVPIVGDGSTPFQPISIEDVARCILIALERGPSDHIHEIGGPEHLTYEQIVDTVMECIGKHRPKVHVPVTAMLPLAFLMDKVLPNPPVTPDQLRLLEQMNITRLDAVASQFGFLPQRLVDNCAYLNEY